MATTPHLDDPMLEAYLDARQRDPAVLAHVRGCDACLTQVRAARFDRVLARAALQGTDTHDRHPSDEVIAAICDERLDDDATRAAATHLARCAVCLDHYRDLLNALAPETPAAAAPSPRPVGAPLGANGRTPSEVTADANFSPAPPITAAPTPDATALTPTPNTFGTIFITRFADELRLTFIAAPHAIPSFWTQGSGRSGDRPFDPDVFGSMTSTNLRARTSSARRAEVRSRSFSDVMRRLAPQRREPVQPRPRPTVRIELPGAIAAVELVDLHDGEVKLTIHVLASRLRDGRAVQLTVLAPNRRPETVALASRTPIHLAPATTPITLAFEYDDGEAVRIEVRNLVTRALGA